MAHDQEGAWQLSHSLANNLKGVHVTETFVMAIFKYGHVLGHWIHSSTAIMKSGIARVACEHLVICV